ncbi:MAG: hypothetical protein IH935_10180 [Acidobacteria bacterium]|nr:hypothetical protein [Acidobacteriota bacterium]MCH8267590.1 hypothetical protein [Acidobacteriota bacterium]
MPVGYPAINEDLGDLLVWDALSWLRFHRFEDAGSHDERFFSSWALPKKTKTHGKETRSPWLPKHFIVVRFNVTPDFLHPN